MGYRQELYPKYVSTHSSQLYGEVSLNDVEKQFPVWNGYYGRYLFKDKDIKILEIGCADGGFIYWLQGLGYKNSFGIDISEEQIKLAEKLGIKNVERTDLIEFLKDKNEDYDIVFARDVMEHFNKEEILNIAGLVYVSLSKGGEFIIQSANAESPFSTRCRYGDFTHEIAFTKNSLSQILRASGFRKIEFYPAGPVIHGIKSAIRYFLWKLIEVFLRFYILVETGDSKGIFTQNLICIARK